MAMERRLLVVVAGLAAAALLSSSQSHGDPAGKNDRPNLTPAGPKAPVAPVIQGKNVDDEPSVSRFALGRTITYRPLEGDPYFALQIQPKPEQIQPKADADAKPRGRDYLIMISTSATQAINSFDRGKHRQRILLFLGDGLSTHNPMTNADRRALCENMIKNNIAFFPVPLGSSLNPENLHGLATGTGGMVLRTELAEKLEDALKRYEAALAAPIFYPTKFVMPADVTEYYAAKLPPLRSATPTLVIGLVNAASGELTFTT